MMQLNPGGASGMEAMMVLRVNPLQNMCLPFPPQFRGGRYGYTYKYNNNRHQSRRLPI